MTRADLTPVILTYNEEPNLARTLAALQWAKRIVIVDSGSSDGTETVAKAHPNVDWRRRPFDRHGAQWAYAIQGTGIESPWVLALDADMVVPAGFVEEFEGAFNRIDYAGGVVSFVYRSMGRDLRGSLYPPDLRVVRPQNVRVFQDGHTQRFHADGHLYWFRCRIAHDDRKPLDRWVQDQLRYSSLEAGKLMSSHPRPGLKSKVRRLGLMPLLGGIAAYLRAGGPLKGKAALEYAYERLTFETLLAMRVLRQEAATPPALIDPEVARHQKCAK
jgi:glycosyltransferase involved in cell wall biosynthesis